MWRSARDRRRWLSWRRWVWNIRCRRWWMRIHCLSLQIHCLSPQIQRDCWSPNRHACLNADRAQMGRRLRGVQQTGKFRRKGARNTTGIDRRWRRKRRRRSRSEKRGGHWGDWRKTARRESSRTAEGCRRVSEKRKEKTGWTWRTRMGLRQTDGAPSLGGRATCRRCD